MADTQQNEASRFPAAAVLGNVCSSSGRGALCVLEQIQGVIRIGDDRGPPSGSIKAVGPVQIWGSR